MTKEEIDKLESVELARACAEAMGWHTDKHRVWWFDRDGDTIALLKEWRPNTNANHAREMVGSLATTEDRHAFDVAIEECLVTNPIPVFTADLKTICRCFLKAKQEAKP